MLSDHKKKIHAPLMDKKSYSTISLLQSAQCYLNIHEALKIPKQQVPYPANQAYYIIYLFLFYSYQLFL